MSQVGSVAHRGSCARSAEGDLGRVDVVVRQRGSSATIRVTSTICAAFGTAMWSMVNRPGMPWGKPRGHLQLALSEHVRVRDSAGETAGVLTAPHRVSAGAVTLDEAPIQRTSAFELDPVPPR